MTELKMLSPLTALLGVLSAGLWIAVGYLLVRAWRMDPNAEDYDLDPADGCGCVEMWEYLSERRQE